MGVVAVRYQVRKGEKEQKSVDIPQIFFLGQGEGSLEPSENKKATQIHALIHPVMAALRFFFRPDLFRSAVSFSLFCRMPSRYVCAPTGCFGLKNHVVRSSDSLKIHLNYEIERFVESYFCTLFLRE